jgi:CRISPR type III-A-associated RAMP protein Csm4
VNPSVDRHELVCLLEPLSPFLTEPHADVLWGMLAWACRWLHGEQALKDDFLALDADGCPPVLLSDAFPEECLPRPAVPVTADDVRHAIQAANNSAVETNNFEAVVAAKHWLEEPYLNQDDVADLLRGTKTTADLLGKHLPTIMAKRSNRRGRGRKEEEPPIVYRRHNVIDRSRAGALRKHGLYTHEEHVLRNKKLVVHVRSTWPAERLRPLFEHVGDNGFGKRASTGLGRFAVEALRRPTEYEKLPTVDDANGFMTLSSSYVPAKGEDVAGGWYEFHVKQGKVGHAMAVGPPGDHHYLKHPVVMFRAGSVFPAREPERPWFGRQLRGLCPERPDVVHYGFAFAVPCRLFARPAAPAAP